jgi:hypothetical protein
MTIDLYSARCVSEKGPGPIRSTGYSKYPGPTRSTGRSKDGEKVV